MWKYELYCPFLHPFFDGKVKGKVAARNKANELAETLYNDKDKILAEQRQFADYLIASMPAEEADAIRQTFYRRTPGCASETSASSGTG